MKLHFSGHETFAIRHGWLKKVVDALDNDSTPIETNVFKSEEAIAKFGVGRNMVASMAHWAQTCGLIEPNRLRVTDLGKFLFSEDEGVDRYLEDEAILWLLHWKLTESVIPSTTWFFAFHNFSGVSFDKQRLEWALSEYCREKEYTRLNKNTLSRDVDCFINTYVVKKNRKGDISEDSLECPLVELDLILETDSRGSYEFNIGPKDTLTDTIFAYALLSYFHQRQGGTLSLEQILYDPGSPGQAFKLDESSITDRLVEIEAHSDGLFKWVDTAGLRQVQLLELNADPLDVLRKHYKPEQIIAREAA